MKIECTAVTAAAVAVVFVVPHTEFHIEWEMTLMTITSSHITAIPACGDEDGAMEKWSAMDERLIEKRFGFI